MDNGRYPERFGSLADRQPLDFAEHEDGSERIRQAGHRMLDQLPQLLSRDEGVGRGHV